MASKKSKPNHSSFPLIIILPIALLLLTLNCIHRFSERSDLSPSHLIQNNGSIPPQNPYPEKALFRASRNPEWYDIIAKENLDRRLKVGLVNINGGILHLHEAIDVMNVGFTKVGNDIEWNDLFPEWIDENVPWVSQGCPKIPLPNFEDYQDFDVVVAKVPCGGGGTKGRGFRDVFRLQVNLVVANLLVKSGRRNGVDQPDRPELYVVFIGSCGPMWEIFRCDDLVWHEGNVWIYRPDLRRLNEKVIMPVGTCQLAPSFAKSGEEERDIYLQREAYVTVLHSSEAYVCGAIALAQSITKTNTTKDLILLADDSISAKSLHGLRSAGWKIKKIQRIKSPQAKKNAYNEWNYTKLRLWQVTEYQKLIFIDSDFIVLKNIDHFFNYPQLSAAGNDKYLFNSGLMLIEPSKCVFERLMKERFKTESYNGGDQGYLNEMFIWWHRWPTKINHLKFFGNNHGDDEDERGVPEDIYALHYLGLKPWMCYEDYDCNWDRLGYHQFASDLAHKKWWNVYESMGENLKEYCALTPSMDARIRMWRGKAKKDNLVNGHWRIDVKDPRMVSI